MSFDSEILHDPYRVAVTKNGEWVATFTPDCYTVITAGPERVFTEKFQRGGETVEVRVGHRTWVRAAPGPVDTKIDKRWLSLALDANQRHVPDALAIAMQYLKGCRPCCSAIIRSRVTPRTDRFKRKVPTSTTTSGSAGSTRTIRPTNRNRTNFDASTARASCAWFGVIDITCRGPDTSIRYRCRFALRNGSALPRRAVEMYHCAPGLILAADNGSQLEDFEHIDIGDLVYFDGSDDDGDDIDHVGMYLGTDTGGHHRFISSRKTPDDPTFADYGGSSVLDGAGHYAKAFRAIRRL